MTTWPARACATIFVLLGGASLPACADAASAPPPATPATSPSVDRANASAAIARELDDLNDAAARADEARYFAHFADESVFLGTDATERWDLPAFRAFAHPHFAKGKAWTFRAVRRAVTIADDGRFAYFDEDLATEKLGPARGSGVLVLDNGRWKIAQYNLSVVVPNERFGELRALLERAPAPSPETFGERRRAAYDRATAAADHGDLAGAARELSSLLDEASNREDDDAAFWMHNQLTWVRWAEGDLVGALGEVDGARSALARARLPADKSAADGLHEKWDRAYLLLELARAAPPTSRAKAMAAADAARLDYEHAAVPRGDHDGLAVLASFFAVRNGDGKKALASAKQVDADKDDDLQDIYVLALAYDAGGDHARANALRTRIREGHPYLMKPLIVRQLDADAHAGPSR